MAPPITHWLHRAPLGSGSFGKVSLAINLDDGLPFAVKSMLCSGSAAELSSFETELSILESLRCPRIITCYGGAFSNGDSTSRNIFLEYMEGGSLAELIKKSGGCLDESRVQCYTRAIVEGLSYLHEQGVVHCDIKGQNILLGSSGVKIADFGAAKRLSEHASALNFKGTPLWMAPEVIQGMEQGCASDIWSLGCTVVEMLQGRSPWGESKQNSHLSMTHTAAILYKIGYSQEDASLPTGISAECRDFLCKALQRDAKLRASAAELLNHPWLQTAPEFESYCCAQPSPRSTLEFFSDSDADEHDTCGSLSLLVASEPVEKGVVAACAESFIPIDADVCVPKHCEWITVRRADSWLESRQKPFMTRHEGTRMPDKTREFDSDSLAFLHERRVKVKGGLHGGI